MTKSSIITFTRLQQRTTRLGTPTKPSTCKEKAVNVMHACQCGV